MTDFRAKTLKEAFRLCDVNPLTGQGLERYYVDLAPVRKTEAIEGVNTVLDFHRYCARRKILSIALVSRTLSQW